jgi:cell division septum initiation protein DivIVA
MANQLPQKLCKNNYMDFLQSLSGVNDLQANIKDLKTELTEVASQVSSIEANYFQQAQKSMAIKQSYFDVSKSILDFKSTRVSH